MKKRILVTGGLGTIGSCVVPFFRKREYDVLSSDILIRDFPDYVRGDITDFENMYRIFKEYKPDVVIHMAAEVGRIVGEGHPHRVFNINILGSLNVIRLCLEFDSFLVNFSTSEVYGHLLDTGESVKESDLEKYGNFFAPTNLYAMSKLFVEGMIKHYVDNYGLKAVSVRPFMIYTPDEFPSKYRSALINFVHNALTNKKLIVHKGTVRSWCYISDFAEAVRLVVESPFRNTYEAYNIGSDEYYTSEEVAKVVLDACEKSYDLIELVEPPNKFLSLVKRFSIEKLEKLGYKPQVSLKEGVKRVVEWQRCRRDR
jgi:nucleoside-diphosphate-sugar epimerase